MSLSEMNRLLELARKNLNASPTADADMKLYMTLDCLIDVVNGLVSRQEAIGGTISTM